MGKGGGPAGSIGYPQAIDDRHPGWMDELKVLVDEQITVANPWTAGAAYDPDADIDVSQDRFDEFDTDVTALSHTTDFSAAMTQAVSDVDTNLAVDAAAINAAVTAYEVQQKVVLNRGINRVSSGFADMNSVNGSAFVMAVALEEIQYENNVAAYRQRLELAADEQRRQAIMQSTSLMANMLFKNISASHTATVMQSELGRMKVVMKGEQIKEDLGIDVKDRLWDIELFRDLGNFMAAPGSGSFIDNEPKRGFGTALGGAMSGAAAGAGLAYFMGVGGGGAAGASAAAAPVAMSLAAPTGAAAVGAEVGATAGAAGGPPGLLIGAGIGGLLGAAASLF